MENVPDNLGRRSVWWCRGGNVAIALAVAMPALIGAIGLGVDVSYNYATSEKMQTAADFAALSAAQAYAKNSSANLQSEASFVTGQYGFTQANGAITKASMPPTGGLHNQSSGYIEVTITQPQSIFFAQIFGLSIQNIFVRAVSLPAAPVCVLALDTAANNAISISGTSAISVPRCNIAANSNSSSSISSNGSATISAFSIQTVGGENLSSGTSLSITGKNQSYSTATTDPFSRLSVPNFSGCDQNNYSTSSIVTLNPGVYCGGLKLAGSANVTLNPGVYFMDRGSLQMTGGSFLSGNGVTIILTSSTGNNYGGISLSGGSVLNLSAPTSGTTAGIAIFGDRNMPTSTNMNLIGGANQTISGTVYVPSGQISWAGSSTATSQCTKLIGGTISFTGNAAFETQCSAYGAAFSTTTSKVVE